MREERAAAYPFPVLPPPLETETADYRLFFQRSALGSGILFTYPEISTIAGVQGLVVYALSSALPLLVFGFLGPIIRRKCPEGFVLTEWTRQRYGPVTALYLSLLTYALINMSAKLRFAKQISQAYHYISLYGRRALRSSADSQRFDRPLWPSRGCRGMRCHHSLYMGVSLSCLTDLSNT